MRARRRFGDMEWDSRYMSKTDAVSPFWFDRVLPPPKCGTPKLPNECLMYDGRTPGRGTRTKVSTGCFHGDEIIKTQLPFRFCCHLGPFGCIWSTDFFHLFPSLASYSLIDKTGLRRTQLDPERRRYSAAIGGVLTQDLEYTPMMIRPVDSGAGSID